MKKMIKKTHATCPGKNLHCCNECTVFQYCSTSQTKAKKRIQPYNEATTHAVSVEVMLSIN